MNGFRREQAQVARMHGTHTHIAIDDQLGDAYLTLEEIPEEPLLPGALLPPPAAERTYRQQNDVAGGAVDNALFL